MFDSIARGSQQDNSGVVSGRLGREQRLEVFRRVVDGELRSRPMSTLHRRRLVRYAARLDISAAEAVNVITEAKRVHVYAHNRDRRQEADPQVVPARKPWPTWVGLVAVIVIAAVLDLLLAHFVGR